MPLIDGNGKPLEISIEPGRHTLEMGNQGGSVFARLALATQMPEPGLFGKARAPDFPRVAESRGCSNRRRLTLIPAGKSPEVLLSFLNPGPVTLTQSKLSYRTRFFGQKLVILPQAKADVKAVNPRSLVLVYPYEKGTEQPTISSRLVDGLPTAELKWKNAVDKITPSKDGLLTVTRELPGGGKDILSNLVIGH